MKKSKVKKYKRILSILLVSILLFQFSLSAMASDNNHVTEVQNNAATTETQYTAKAPSEEPATGEAPSEEPVTTEVPGEEPVITEVPGEEPATAETPSEEQATTEVPSETPAAAESTDSEVQNTEEQASTSPQPFSLHGKGRSGSMDRTEDTDQLKLEISNLNWKDINDRWNPFGKNGNIYEFSGTMYEQIKKMTFTLDFSILKAATPDRTICGGDYFQVTLPEAFQVTDVTSPQPIGYNEHTIANYTINSNVIKVVFTERVDWESGLGSVKGGCNMEFTLDDNAFSGDYDGKIPFTLQGSSNSITITIPPKSTIVDGIEKKAVYHPENGTITWKIKVGTLTPGQDISGVMINDTFDSSKQDYQSLTPTLDNFTNDNNGNISFNVPSGTTAPAEFELTTKVNSSLYESAAEGIVNNRVVMTLPSGSALTLGENTTSSDQVTVPKITIKKECTQLNSGRMHWTIKVNESKGTIFNPSVTDDLSNSGKLVNDSIKVDGNPVAISGAQQGEISATLSEKLLTVYLTSRDASINSNHTITFDTTVNADDMINPDSKLTNEAKLSCNLFTSEGLPVNPSSGVITAPFNTVYIQKAFQEFDSKKGLITWKINPSTRATNYDNAVITDAIPADQEYVKDSVVIKESGGSVDPNLYQVDYTESQLAITMNGTTKPDFNNWTITFQTKAKNYFTENTIGSDTTKYHSYSNRATITVTKDGTPFSHTSSASTNQANHFLNKSTEFQYNADENAIYMHYTITVNADNVDLGNIVVKDDLNLLTTDILRPEGIGTGKQIAPGDWELVKEKTKITPADAVPQYSGTDGKNLTVSFGSESGSKHKIDIYIRLKEDAKNKYLSTGNIVKTSNTVLAKADKFSEGIDCSVTSTGSGNGGQVVNKLLNKAVSSVVKDPLNKKPSYIPWTVTINPNGVVFRDKTGENPASGVVLKDIYPKGLRVDQTSIKRYGLDASGRVNTSKVLDITNYNMNPLEDGSTELNVAFPNDGKPCAIVYHTTIVQPIEGLKVTNKANLMIDGDNRDTSSKTASVSSVDWGYLDYTASFQIVKTDAVSEGKLKGAVFGLYTDEACTDLIDKKTSDAGGNLYFYALELNKPYYYKEIKAPEGYIINSTNDKGVKITATKAGMIKEKQIVKNERSANGTIVFQKEFADSTGGLQAEFQLTRTMSSGDQTVHVVGNNGDYTYTEDNAAATDFTNKKENGQVKISKLPWGDYKLKEVKTQDGYRLESSQTNISILQDGTVTYDAAPSLTIKNYPILLTIKKTDMMGAALGGNPEFQLSGIFADSKGTSTNKVLNTENAYTLDRLLIAGNTYQLKETRPANGYLLETTEMQVSVDALGIITVSGGSIASASTEAASGRTTITFQNEPTDFKLSKTDMTETGLDGAKFKITGNFADNSTEKTLSPAKATDAQLTGQLIVGNTYVITETTAPTGYHKYDTAIQIKIQKDGKLVIVNEDEVKDLVRVKADAVTLQVKNEVNYNDIWFHKLGTSDEVDINKTSKLDGAKFTLYSKSNPDEIVKNKNGQLLKDIESKDGKVVFKNVYIGEYIVKETKTPKNYKPAASEWYANISENGEYSGLMFPDVTPVTDNTIVNQAVRGEVSLKKVDEDKPTKCLAGVTFAIYKNGEKDPFATVVTDNMGQVTIRGLLMDRQYTVKEIDTLSDYVLADQSRDFKLKESDADSSGIVKKDLGVFTNLPVKLTFYRQVDNNQPLPGAVFGLYAADDKNFEHALQEKTSGSDGKIVFEHLDKTKDYIIKEVSAPAGYTKDSNTYTVTYNPDGYCSLLDADGDVVQIVDTSKGQITLMKTESHNSAKYLKGAVFAISEKNNGEVILEEKTTNENGKLIFKNLPMGTYIIKEVKAPDGYQLSSDTTEVILSLGANQKQTIGVTNQLSMLSFIKGGKYTETCSQNPDALKVLSNAAFGVYAKNDKQFRSPIAKAVSGEDGKVVFHGIVDGEYTIKEISAPEGYLLSDAVYKTVIKDGFVKSITDEAGSQIKDNIIINDVARANFTFTKVDEKEQNKVLPGSTYGLYSAGTVTKGGSVKGNSIIKTSENIGETLISTQITGADGRIVFEGLLINTQYVLRELAAPQGSLVSANPIRFYFEQTDSEQKPVLKINDNGDGTIKRSEDGSITWLEPPTVISILKTDLSGKKNLSGAQLVLKDQKGATIDTWTSGENAYIIQGRLTGNESYTLEEAKAPMGYVPAEPITFTVDAEPAGPGQDNTQQIVLKNDTTKVLVTKIDAESKQAISGASLTIQDNKGSIVEEWVTDGREHLIEGKLAAGDSYTLTETKAPDGYEAAKSIDFTVNKDGSVLNIIMEDKKTGETAANPSQNEPGKTEKPENPAKPANSAKPNKPTVPTTGDSTNAGVLLLFIFFAGLMILRIGVKWRRN